jgi:hypothetical protein
MAAPDYPPVIAHLIAASAAEDALCQDHDGGLSDLACDRRDAIDDEIHARGWCWGPDTAAEADRSWMRKGSTCHN